MPGERLLAALSPLRQFLPELSSGMAERLEAYVDLLLRWNKTINLTAVRDFDPAVRKHVAEAVFLATRLPAAGSACDVGSGGGVPGIPLAILHPELDVTLVEADVRKSVFLREAGRDLRNVRVYTGRAEDLDGGFDWVTSRAVNLGGLKRGPAADAAAFLGGAECPSGGIAGRYLWTGEPVPWQGGGFLWLGHVSRETPVA